MSTAGYSGTPLPKKLGIEEGSRVLVAGAPEGFFETLGSLPSGVELLSRAGKELDVVVLFVERRADLVRRFGRLAGALAPTGALWVAWPKKASRVPTDLSESEVRRIGLESGLVDNKVAAIDEVWSGLRFVARLKDRVPGR
jgi:hypothetical protein